MLTAPGIKIVDPFFWGRPSGIVSTLRDWFQHGTQYGSIWANIWVTLKEAVLGFLFGTVAGVIVGIGLGQFRFLSDVLNPYIKVLNAIPRIVLAALFIVAFGVGIESKVMTAAVLVFFGVFFNAYQGVREVDQNLIANARVLGRAVGRPTAMWCCPPRRPGSSPASTSPSASRSSAPSSARCWEPRRDSDS